MSVGCLGCARASPCPRLTFRFVRDTRRAFAPIRRLGRRSSRLARQGTPRGRERRAGGGGRPREAARCRTVQQGRSKRRLGAFPWQNYWVVPLGFSKAIIMTSLIREFQQDSSKTIYLSGVTIHAQGGADGCWLLLQQE